jgi:hypothetical protein
LLNETISEKFRLIQGERFPENNHNQCYLSLSERVFTPNGEMSGCSHLMRDGILIEPGRKHEKCRYGCNRRLVAFNELIQSRIVREDPPQENSGGACHDPATAALQNGAVE